MKQKIDESSMAWWEEALRLEQLDRLEEAERVVQKAMRVYGDKWQRQCAYIYELRSRRMHGQGNAAAAKQAADRANELMQQYVAGARTKADKAELSREAAQIAQRISDTLSNSNKPQEPSGWWAEAIRLERLDQLAEAEKVIEEAMRPKGDPWDYQCAYLYELRAIRLHKEGNDKAAWAAAARANEMMRSYASGATSGGEGVAFSREADRAAAALADILNRPAVD